MTTQLINVEFIKNLKERNEKLGLCDYITLKEIEKAKSIISQISRIFPFFNKNKDGVFSRKFTGNLEYGTCVFDDCNIEIEIDINLCKITIFFQFAPYEYYEREIYIFTLDDICKFELKYNNTLVLL